MKGHLGWGIRGLKGTSVQDLRGSAQDREPTSLCQPPTYSEYHERVRSQGQQLQQLQAELDKLHKEVSSVRAANSEVRTAASCLSKVLPMSPHTAQSKVHLGSPLQSPFLGSGAVNPAPEPQLGISLSGSIKSNPENLVPELCLPVNPPASSIPPGSALPLFREWPRLYSRG